MWFNDNIHNEMLIHILKYLFSLHNILFTIILVGFKLFFLINSSSLGVFDTIIYNSMNNYVFLY